MAECLTCSKETTINKEIIEGMKNTISYFINDETIDMMTLDSFSFVHSVIHELEQQSGLDRYDVGSILNDRFVSQGLMTITESIE